MGNVCVLLEKRGNSHSLMSVTMGKVTEGRSVLAQCNGYGIFSRVKGYCCNVTIMINLR